MPDFKSLLSKPVDDIKKPPAMPVGTFYGRIAKFEYLEAKNDNKTPYVKLEVKFHSPGPDIDPADLVGIDLSKKTLSRNYFLTEDALHRLKTLMDSCGIVYHGRTLNETIPELLNADVIASITQRPSQDGQDIYNDIGDLKGTAN